MSLSIVNDFATACRAAKSESSSGDGPHKTANIAMKREFLQEELRVNVKKKRYGPTLQKRASIITRFWDESMEASIEKGRAVFFKDPNGIDMTYPHGSKVAKLSQLRIIDNHGLDDSFNVIVGCKKKQKNTSIFIALKVSQRQKIIQPERMKIYDLALQGMLENKPNVIRGTLRNGVSPHYVCHGFRKNPLDREIGEYTYNAGVSEWKKLEINQEINNLVGEVERKAIDEINAANLSVCVGYADFFRVQEKFDLPSLNVGGIATQVALSIGYCSKVHTDKDFFITTLAVYDDLAGLEEILQYFCFPTYGIAIPMRSGDIIVFNPLVHHCATNPSRETAKIYSCYVSNKTCNTAASSKTTNCKTSGDSE